MPTISQTIPEILATERANAEANPTSGRAGFDEATTQRLLARLVKAVEDLVVLLEPSP